MTSSFSKKVHFDRLPDDRRCPLSDRWHFRRGFPIGSDVVSEVADVPEVATGGGDASVHVKLDRQYVHGRVLQIAENTSLP